MIKLDDRSKAAVEGVNPALYKLTCLVFKRLEGTEYRIVITEGLRTPKRQQVLLSSGKSSTLNSRHLTGHAVDFAVFLNGELTWVFEHYEKIAQIWKECSRDAGTQITWGGDWTKFLDGKKDGTHIQLTWENFPLEGTIPKTIPTSKTVIAAAITPIIAAAPEAIEVLRKSADVVEQVSGSRWLAIAIIAVISIFVIYERVKKIRGEGL